ncbi:molybdopterin-dependent oxidoreductase [Haloplanus sp. GCM10025708]|uniref:molybdopterin-dependent oxidoreductase n=1 Tax=Haloferacaceae TaxID=1644056 RepID=UPI00360AB111
MTADRPASGANERYRWTNAAVAAAAGVGAVAGSHAVAGASPAFVAAPIASLVVDATPGVVVTVAILFLGALGDQVAFGVALAATVGLFAVAADAGRRLGERVGPPPVAAVAGALATALGFALVGDAASSIAAGVGTAIVRSVATLATGDRSADDAGRRRLLGSLAAAAGLAVISSLLGRRRAPDVDRTLDDVSSAPAPSAPTDATPTPVEDGAMETSEPTPQPTTDPSAAARKRLLAEAAEKSLDVDGLDPLVSPTFYEVDVNQINPRPTAEEWTLTVTGAVDKERTFSYEGITRMPAENRFVTLRCVGDPIDGRQLDNALWTGVPMADLLDAAGARGAYVMLRAVDGFYEEMPTAALRPGLLAYGMNDRLLPNSHGYPARALVPGHWGEVNVKWLTEIEVLDEPATGYWEKRGWHGTGPVNTVAKLSAVNRSPEEIEVAGHAYAGTRGVDRVEVSTNGGRSWRRAALSDPLPGDDVWRQWVSRYEPPVGEHEVVVRAVDGTGTVQPRARENAYPSGATGWVSRTVRPER